MYVYMYVCMCVCVCVSANIRANIARHINYILIQKDYQEDLYEIFIFIYALSH